MNIKWRDVTHMLEALGAELEVVHGGREKVRLRGREQTFHIPHSKVVDSKDEIVQLRRFLSEVGLAPDGIKPQDAQGERHAKGV
jgi:hypothetical protein